MDRARKWRRILVALLAISCHNTALIGEEVMKMDAIEAFQTLIGLLCVAAVVIGVSC